MVEVPRPPTTASWQKGSASYGGDECVQVVCGKEHVWVRDSKDPLGPALGLTGQGWAAFLGGVRCDEFDLNC